MYFKGKVKHTFRNVFMIMKQLRGTVSNIFFLTSSQEKKKTYFSAL